jgi:hypothetical protein
MDLKKQAILKYINEHKSSYEVFKFLILKKKDVDDKNIYFTGKVSFSYYLLYKDDELYTTHSEKWATEEGTISRKKYGATNTVFHNVEVFDYNNSIDVYKELFDELYNELSTISPNKTMFGRLKGIFSSNRVEPVASVGGNPIASVASAASAAPSYKLNGEKVHLLINKKKLHRSVYVKDKGNGKAKYCKINNEFVLLSKLKNKII